MKRKRRLAESCGEPNQFVVDNEANEGTQRKKGKTDIATQLDIGDDADSSSDSLDRGSNTNGRKRPRERSGNISLSPEENSSKRFCSAERDSGFADSSEDDVPSPQGSLQTPGISNGSRCTIRLDLTEPRFSEALKKICETSYSSGYISEVEMQANAEDSSGETRVPGVSNSENLGGCQVEVESSSLEDSNSDPERTSPGIHAASTSPEQFPETSEASASSTTSGRSTSSPSGEDLVSNATPTLNGSHAEIPEAVPATSETRGIPQETATEDVESAVESISDAEIADNLRTHLSFSNAGNSSPKVLAQTISNTLRKDTAQTCQPVVSSSTAGECPKEVRKEDVESDVPNVTDGDHLKTLQTFCSTFEVAPERATKTWRGNASSPSNGNPTVKLKINPEASAAEDSTQGGPEKRLQPNTPSTSNGDRVETLQVNFLTSRTEKSKPGAAKNGLELKGTITSNGDRVDTLASLLQTHSSGDSPRRGTENSQSPASNMLNGDHTQTLPAVPSASRAEESALMRARKCMESRVPRATDGLHTEALQVVPSTSKAGESSQGEAKKVLRQIVPCISVQDLSNALQTVPSTSQTGAETASRKGGEPTALGTLKDDPSKMLPTISSTCREEDWRLEDLENMRPRFSPPSIGVLHDRYYAVPSTSKAGELLGWTTEDKPASEPSSSTSSPRKVEENAVWLQPDSSTPITISTPHPADAGEDEKALSSELDLNFPLLIYAVARQCFGLPRPNGSSPTQTKTSGGKTEETVFASGGYRNSRRRHAEKKAWKIATMAVMNATLNDRHVISELRSTVIHYKSQLVTLVSMMEGNAQVEDVHTAATRLLADLEDFLRQIMFQTKAETSHMDRCQHLLQEVLLHRDGLVTCVVSSTGIERENLASLENDFVRIPEIQDEAGEEQWRRIQEDDVEQGSGDDTDYCHSQVNFTPETLTAVVSATMQGILSQLQKESGLEDLMAIVDGSVDEVRDMYPLAAEKFRLKEDFNMDLLHLASGSLLSKLENEECITWRLMREFRQFLVLFQTTHTLMMSQVVAASDSDVNTEGKEDLEEDQSEEIKCLEDVRRGATNGANDVMKSLEDTDPRTRRHRAVSEVRRAVAAMFAAYHEFQEKRPNHPLLYLGRFEKDLRTFQMEMQMSPLATQAQLDRARQIILACQEAKASIVEAAQSPRLDFLIERYGQEDDSKATDEHMDVVDKTTGEEETPQVKMEEQYTQLEELRQHIESSMFAVRLCCFIDPCVTEEIAKILTNIDSLKEEVVREAIDGDAFQRRKQNLENYFRTIDARLRSELREATMTWEALKEQDKQEIRRINRQPRSRKGKGGGVAKGKRRSKVPFFMHIQYANNIVFNQLDWTSA